MKCNYSIRKFTIVAAFACVCFVAAPASAGNNVKKGFEDQIGRLLAVAVMNVGHAVLIPHHYPVYHRPVYHRPVYHRPVYHRPSHHRPVYHRPSHHRPSHHRPYYVKRNIYSHCNYTDPTVMAFCINSANKSLWYR